VWELIQREVADRLEDLLVGPTAFAGLLVQVERGWPVRLQRGLQVDEQRLLLGVRGGEAACPRDLVEAEPGAPGRLRVLGDAVVALAVLGYRERDPLPGRLRQ